MERKIVWEMIGFKKLVLKDNEKYYLENHKLLKSIYIGCDNSGFTRLEIEIKDQVDITQEFYEEIGNIAENICLNLIINEDILINKPLIRVIEDNLMPEYKKQNDYIEIRSSLKMIAKLPALDIYKEALRLDKNYAKNKLIYYRIFRLLECDNELIQFLGLYDFLLELTNKGNSEKIQAKLVTFIQENQSELKKFYNNRADFFEIKPTGVRNKLEDGLTRFRNKIAHSERVDDAKEYTALEKSAKSYIKPVIFAIYYYLTKNSDIL